jgi:AcrR family transcriptional regulator
MNLDDEMNVADEGSRRSQILAMATRIFVKRGFEAPTMAELAEACGCQRRTLYRYFPSKEDLFWAAAERAYTMLAERISLVGGVWKSGRVSAIGRVRSWAMTYFDFSLENLSEFRLIMDAREKTLATGADAPEGAGPEYVIAKIGRHGAALAALDQRVLAGLAPLSGQLESEGVCPVGSGAQALWELLGVLIGLVEFHARYRNGGSGYPFGTPEGIRSMIDKQVDMAFQAKGEDR